MINNGVFKNAAIEILRKFGKPMSYKEITSIALETGILKSEGKTPWATMSSTLCMDIIHNQSNSPFYKTEPGFYGLKDSEYINKVQIVEEIKDDNNFTNEVRDYVNSQQKGNIGESRIAELLTLYGNEGLSCYRPVSDDEGIDIIVKKRNTLDSAYIQVKTTFGPSNGRGFVSTVKDKNLITKARMLYVFVYFDTTEGDLFDYIFCIPGPEFAKLTETEDNKNNQRTFTVSLNNPENSKYAEFMIEKRELANKVIEYLDRL
jgi:hypothetical protein